MKKILIIIIVVLCFGYGISYLHQNKSDNAVNSKYLNCELGDLVGEDVERIVYKNFNIDYHTEDFTKSQVENFARECIDEGVKNQYQADCCMRMKMYPDD